MDNELLYVASPYRGDVDRNRKYAIELTRKAALLGYNPITPHLYITLALDDDREDEREAGIEIGAAILHRCTKMLVGMKYGISAGMEAEIKMAESLGLDMIYVE